MDIVETFHTVYCSACAWELVAGLLQPKPFLLASWAKLKLAAQIGTHGRKSTNDTRENYEVYFSKGLLNTFVVS